MDLTGVKIDHTNDTTDVEYLKWILDQGRYLGLCRYLSQLVIPHSRTVTLKTLIDEGFGDKLCPSHDCICLTVLKENDDGSMPDMREYAQDNHHAYLYINREVIPNLKEMGVTDSAIEDLFANNPRRPFCAKLINH